MRIVNILGALAGLAAAIPYPQDDSSGDPDTITLPFPTPTIPVIATTSLNIPVTLSLDIPIATRSKKPHWEPIPIFTKECKCNVATVRYPCWATDALQVSTCWAVVDTQSMEIPRKDWLCLSIYTARWILTSLVLRNVTTRRTFHTDATWRQLVGAQHLQEL
jgi:hypothetical protein